jgi:hypothetical protein
MTGPWIAERELRLKKNGEDLPVYVRIAAPFRVPNVDHFQCTFKIDGPGFEDERNIYGFDGVQALQMAMVIIESLLQQLGENCSWDGQKGYTGFPKSVAAVMGDTESSDKKVDE